MNDRLQRLRKMMADTNLDGVLITQPENRRYLSGFTGSAGSLVITPNRQAIITDTRYYQQVETQCPGWELFKARRRLEERLLEVLQSLGLGGSNVGFEAGHVSVEMFGSWLFLVEEQVTLVGTSGMVEQLRQSKQADELQAIERAVALADEALAHVYQKLQPGLTERQVAWELESCMRTRGASATAFEIIVASGPNGALPHARPGQRVIQAGEPIVMDLGCVVDGYRSDVTRTVCLGRPQDGRYLEIWQLVLEALQATEAGIKAGMPACQADELARRVIERAGYADYFGHGLGHGVGLAIHEAPLINSGNDDPIPASAAVTIEPGVYLPGWGGVRIEDLLVVEEESARVLTRAEKVALL